MKQGRAFDPFKVRISTLYYIRKRIGTSEFNRSKLLSDWLRLARYILPVADFDSWRAECLDWNKNRKRCIYSLALYISENIPLVTLNSSGMPFTVTRQWVDSVRKSKLPIGFNIDTCDFEMVKLAITIRIRAERTRRVDT